MEILKRFNDDVNTKEVLLAYFIEYFESKIIERAKEKKDVSSLADAIIELEKAFDQLNIDFNAKHKATEEVNQAR